jgi:hypothetical protein
MASVTLTVTDVLSLGGKVYVRWSDGVEQEFANLAAAVAMRDRVAEEARRLCRDMAIARYLRVDPTAATPSLIEGHSITITDDSNNMVVVT